MKKKETVEKAKTQLVVFDVEGVLLPKNRFLFDTGKKLGFAKLIKLLLFGFLYEIGALTLESTLRHIYSNLRGVKIETLIGVFEKIPLAEQYSSVFEQLKTQQYKIALISSGLPTIAVNRLASSVGADYSYGIDAAIVNGELTGEISGDVIREKGKLIILTQILRREQLTQSQCAVVADDRNNRCIFLKEVKKIGYHPDFVLRVKADHVITGNLMNVLPIIEGKQIKSGFPSTNDFVRENIHASAFFIPVIAALIGVPAVAVMICLIAAVYAVSELFRLKGVNLPVFSAITKHAASQSELYGFAAAPLYYAFGIVLTLVLFPAPASSAAIAIFALGDSTASIFGGLGSRRLPFNKGKTLEGSLAGFFFAFLAGIVFLFPLTAPPLPVPLIALIGAAIAMIIEYLPLPINDNVTIPLFTGLALTLIIY